MYYTKLQYVATMLNYKQTTDELQIMLHKIAIVLHYTTLHYVPFLTPTMIHNYLMPCVHRKSTQVMQCTVYDDT